jgi:hypothetical protein
MFAQMGLLRPLHDDERTALADSIAEHGIQVPILVADVDGQAYLVDGYHRWQIACDLGLIAEEIPCVYLGTLEHNIAKSISFMVNAARRHLTREDRRALAETEIMNNPQLSDRAIAATCGISHHTVATYRGKIAEDQKTMTELATDPVGDSPTAPEPVHIDVFPPTRVGRDGVEQPAPTAPRVTVTTTTTVTDEPITLYCPHCNGGVHVLHGQGGVQRLAKA